MGVLLLSVAACHQKNASAPAGPDSTAAGVTDSTKKNYFPVADYIRSEIHYVDSMPLALLKYTTRDNHTDSSFIKGDEFHRLAQEFILPELAEEDFEKNYTQNAFEDETSGYLTFTYTPRDKDQSLQRVDVLVTPAAAAANGHDDVKSIYLQTAQSSGDTLVIKKMLWLAKKSMLIITSLQPHEKEPVTRQVKVVWDASPSE